jgi:hypothetical protein
LAVQEQLNMRESRDTRYKRGYRPKIEFWASELLKAAQDKETKYSMEYMVGKLNYFVWKETEREKHL